MRKSLKNYKSTVNNNDEAKQKVGEIMDKYSNMSEDTLFSKLMEEVASKKSEGTFDFESLKKDMDRMRPYLSNAQVQKLDHLLRLIGS